MRWGLRTSFLGWTQTPKLGALALALAVQRDPRRAKQKPPNWFRETTRVHQLTSKNLEERRRLRVWQGGRVTPGPPSRGGWRGNALVAMSPRCPGVPPGLEGLEGSGAGVRRRRYGMLFRAI